MAFEDLLNQTITVENPSSTRDKHGKEALGSATTVDARVQRVNKVVVTKQREKEPVHLEVGVGPGTTIALGARVTYDSEQFRVMTRSEAIGRGGEVHHLEVLCQLWSFT